MEFPIVVLIGIIAFVTYKGLKDYYFFEKYLFHVDRVLVSKEYYRLVTSSFLHNDWIHFAFNAFALYSFGTFLGTQFGFEFLAAIYIISLAGSKALALFIHRNHGDYRSVGASGAVSGLVYAFIGLFPDQGIRMFFIPISIPAWIMGIGYLLYTIYGVKKKFDNIGHESHLGGAITGLIVAVLLKPEYLITNYWVVLLLLIPTSIFMFLMVKKPEFLLIDGYTKYKVGQFKEKKAKERTLSQQEEIDAILDKVSKDGLNSLTDSDKKKVEEVFEGLNYPMQ